MLSATTVDSVVSDCWHQVIERVEGGYPLSSEKTLCFLFAVTMRDYCGATLTVDFEHQCYEKLSGPNKYLDLLFYSDEGFQVAVEMKLPRRSRSGNSNQTQTRKAIYHDLARLSYLKREAPKIGACFFLMAVNEDAYLNNQDIRKGAQYVTRHGHRIRSGDSLVVHGLPLRDVECAFEWKGVKDVDGKHFRTGRFAWLTPIRV